MGGQTCGRCWAAGCGLKLLGGGPGKGEQWTLGVAGRWGHREMGGEALGLGFRASWGLGEGLGGGSAGGIMGERQDRVTQV